MEILHIAWFSWSALWGTFIVSVIVVNSTWDRIAINNLIFHVVAGVVCNLFFWSVSLELNRMLGLLIVWYYSYEFVWHPMRRSYFKKRIPND